MNLAKLVVRNIADSAFRSWIVFLSTVLLAAFAVGGTVVVDGANRSLRLARERLGADIIVVPAGAEVDLENAFLMGQPAHFWMPDTNLAAIAAVDGVQAASPQLYVSTLRGASCCSVPEMFLIGYDPATDFTLRPWLETHIDGGLQVGQGLGGSLVYLPRGDEYILIYGYPLELAGIMDATGAGIDQSLFFTMDTARAIAEGSATEAQEELVIPEDSYSSVLVKTEPGVDVEAVARDIASQVPGVMPVVSANMFQTQRAGIAVLSRSVVALLAIVWVLTVALVAVVFAIAIAERRRHLGVMRALGATRGHVLSTLMGEGALLSLAGGLTGGLIMVAILALFRTLITRALGGPYYYPGMSGLLLTLLGVMAVTLLTVGLAVLIPALRVGWTDPAEAMQE